MFSKKIVETDLFMEMSPTAKILYFYLNMSADDDGFVGNPKTIKLISGATDDDLKILIAKQFIIPFDNGVIVIKDWKIHNYIRKDTYNPTVYKLEKSKLSDDENGAYVLDINKSSTERPREVDTGKDRLGKDRLGEGSNFSRVDTQPDPERGSSCAGPGGDAAPASTKGKPKPQKHKHGENGNVLLTDDELAKLKERFPDWSERIDNLSWYLSSTGKSYKSHYSTILNWARRDGAKARPARMDSAVLSALDSVM